jgi:hypothetical protein
MDHRVVQPFRLHENSLFLSGDPDYIKWREHVLSYFPVTFDGEWIRFKKLNKPVAHLLVVLLRQPIEDGESTGMSKMIKMGDGDPIQELLKVTNGPNFLWNSYGHGLGYMNMRRKDKEIPIEKIRTEKAIQDLMKSQQMINDAWGNDVRIGFVS